MSIKIVSLKSENVKRIKAVEITPTDNMVILGGNNAQGKSSVLDSIFYGLAGKSVTPAQPIHQGEKKATVEIDLGELIVKRTITPKSNTVKVMTKDGAAYSSPQKMLDKLCGKLTFDPLAFANEPPKKQLATLKELVGLDFAKLDEQRDSVFSERTIINREGKAKAAQLEGMPHHEDAPAEEVSVSDLMGQLSAAEEKNRANDKKRDDVNGIHAQLLCVEEDIEDLKGEIAELERKLGMQESSRKSLSKKHDEAKKACANLEDVDTTPIREAIANADSINAKVRDNKQHDALKAEVETLRKQSKALTDKIGEIDADKEKQMKAAEFPIAGLGFDAHGVTYNGLPFEQCSAAESLRISVAMGIALNPELHVMFVRDGSLLDDENMQVLREMCDDSDMQVWVERVGKGDESAIIIEDGEIAE